MIKITVLFISCNLNTKCYWAEKIQKYNRYAVSKLAAISLHFFWYELVVGSDNYQKTFNMSMEENHKRILEIASKYQVSAVNQVNEFGDALSFWSEILLYYECHVFIQLFINNCWLGCSDNCQR